MIHKLDLVAFSHKIKSSTVYHLLLAYTVTQITNYSDSNSFAADYSWWCAESYCREQI